MTGMTRYLMLSLVLLTFGCSALIKEPHVTLKQTNLIGLDTAGADLEFYLGIRNPNAFDLTLLACTFDLRVMTLPMSSGGLNNAIIIPANQETDMRLPVRIRFSDLLEIIKRRPDLNRVPYRMNARLLVKTSLGELVIPVEKNDTFSVPEKYRPDFYLKQLRDVFRESAETM